MSKKQKKNLIRIIIAACLLIALAVLKKVLAFPIYLEFILYMIPYAIVGYDIIKKALKGIQNKQIFDENFLMAVATVGAILLGDFAEGVSVMLFYQIGELFQSYAVGKSRRNISDLMDIRPDYANVEIDGQLEQVDPDEVEIGTIITVKPGEKIPIDGTVTEGTSSLDTSALTGESVPRSVHVGDSVISGSVNGSGLLRIATTKEFGDSTASKVLDMVENASSRKSKSEAFISRFAHYYTPAVCYSALALAILPPFALLIMGQGNTFATWIYRALTFLVISCPCALVISIPLSFFAGIGGASREGVLVKGANYLEALASVDTLVFDKTGTMTKGVFEVNKIFCHDIDESAFLKFAAHAESYSSHPIALSITRAYWKDSNADVDMNLVSSVEEIGGHGVQAIVEESKVAIGNDKLMRQIGLHYDEVTDIGTVIHMAVNDRYVGYLVISDTIKEHAKQAVQELKSSGIRKTVMLTGDAKRVADDVSEKLGIDEVHAELLPGDKVDLVEKLLSEQGSKDKLAFVGDGINDAPVLSRADVGIAMGAMGSDAAIEAADIVLMDDDPLKISRAIKISRKCIRIVYENIYFAIGVKLLCLLLGAFGIANMWAAIFADVGVMIIAVLNAIRALKTK